MSRENVELTYRLYEAVTRRDLDALLAVMDEDVELVSVLVSVEGGYRGQDGIRRWWQHIYDAFSDYPVEVENVRDLGDRTLAALHLHGHGLDSGAPIDQSLWQVVEWRHAKALRLESFRTEAEALEAAGLSG